MSKYLVTMTEGKLHMSSKGYSFRGESSGNSDGRIKFITKICEFKGEQPTESEIKKVAGFQHSSMFGDYFSNHVIFMQKLEEE